MIGHSLASLGQGLISMLLVLQRALLLTKHCRRVKFGVLYTFFIKLENVFEIWFNSAIVFVV